ncbi:hypothetical protein AB0H49_16475 [Nocardia sp. NPDC050713]|uniref:hypothetical protein n=1 Tax=Nocardia sp. NPDC050713 TaxID=3154511 RepID=UPI00340D5DBB
MISVAELDKLRETLSHPYLVELLDALSRRPRTVAELDDIGGGYRSVVRGLRRLAAHGLVFGDGAGSLDQRYPATETFALTGLGLRTATMLSRQDTWEALYEDAFDDGSPDRSDPPRKRK